MHVHVFICLSVCMNVCSYVRTCMHACMCTCMHMYACMHACMYECAHAYTYECKLKIMRREGRIDGIGAIILPYLHIYA